MNVQELLESKQIPYQISGADFVVSCLHPDHEDSHPSMRIDQIMGIFHCMSCGYKGNLFHLYEIAPDYLGMKREGFRKKLDKLRTDTIGLQFPQTRVPYSGSWRNIKNSTYRKFEAFQSPDPEFMGRIVFPIRDVTGRIVVFHGRDETGLLAKKYYNHPRGQSLPLYPTVTPIKGKVILVEGLFDVLNLHDKGLTNSIAIFGADTFTKEKALTLKMQGISGVDCMFDPDEAGEKATTKVQELCTEIGLPTRKVHLKNEDPGELSEIQVQHLRDKLYA